MVERSIDADRVVATLDRLVVERGAPAFIRFDNGREFIAHAVADWPVAATSCSTPGASTACSRPRFSSRTGGSTTT